MRKSQRTSEHGTQKVKTHNRTTHKRKWWATRTPLKNRGWTLVLEKGKQFLLLIRHPPCYSYIQSSPVMFMILLDYNWYIARIYVGIDVVYLNVITINHV
jgi:hypothetical protein